MKRQLDRGPDREGRHNGLAYVLWLPDGPGAKGHGAEPGRGLRPPPPWPGVLILHGAGSRKENHADFARLAASSGWAALAFDQRGHGASEPAMSPEAVADVGRMARLLAAEDGVDAGRVAVRGSSMGGFMAIRGAAAAPEIAAVIAICPAGEHHLRRGVRSGELEMRVESRDELLAWLRRGDVRTAVESLAGRPLLLMHAEGDEQIPASWSQELLEHAAEPRRLLIAPGGDHRSLQHDPELQAEALRWTGRQLER